MNHTYFTYIWLTASQPYLIKNHSDFTKKVSETNIIKMFEFLIDNRFVIFSGCDIQQTAGIHVGTNCISGIYISIYPTLHSLWFLYFFFFKFYGRHHGLFYRYGMSVSQITTDMFRLS